MKLALGMVLGAGIVITVRAVWPPLIIWAFSRGDQP